MTIEKFLDWQIGVDRFFDVMEVSENKQVKMVAIRLKSIAAVWWNKLVFQRQCQRKTPIKTWRRMKQSMLKRFLPESYEKILYKMYINCVQGTGRVTEYTTEFLRFLERNKLGDTKGQKVTRYINGLKGSIQEKTRLQTVWTITEASTLAMKAELMEKSPKNFSSFQRSQENSDVAIDKEKGVGPKEPNSSMDNPSGVSISNPNKGVNPKPANPYGKLEYFKNLTLASSSCFSDCVTNHQCSMRFSAGTPITGATDPAGSARPAIRSRQKTKLIHFQIQSLAA
ncbi:hypothetical protein LINGRAHAP2_LOCUS22325 [Linum grandiflorum]